MLQEKQERLPRLELILFRFNIPFDEQDSLPFDEDLVLAYEQVGLIVDWVNPQTDEGYKTSRMLDWGYEVSARECFPSL